jgi:hypothetical protein
LIVEFIPKEDNKVKLLLESREDIFTDYNIIHFKNCFSRVFDLVEEKSIEESKRTIFLWARTQK